MAQNSTLQANDIVNNEKPSSALYELSLAKKKPPHKLKPLQSAKLSETTNNMALSVLEIENAYQKEILNDIDNDIKDYLDANKIFKEMKSAFNGDD